MKKSLVLVYVLSGVLASCGGASNQASSNTPPSSATNLTNSQINSMLNDQKIEFKDTTITLDTQIADQFNTKGDTLETVSYINTIKETKEKFYIDSGTFSQNFSIKDGTSVFGNATIQGDFVNHGGAVIIDTNYETTIKGKFESTGHSLLTKHRHPTNGIRIVNVGAKSLKVGSALFDGSDIKSDGTFNIGGTEFNIVLTDQIEGSYKSKTPVIDVTETATFSPDKTTIINFEKVNKSIIKKGSTHALVRAKKIEGSIDLFRLDYRFSSTSVPNAREAEDQSIKFTKEIDGTYEYLVMNVLKDISGNSSSYMKRRHQKYAHYLASCGAKKHSFKDKFNVNVQSVSFGTGLTVNAHDSGNGFGFSSGGKTSSLQGYANFDPSSKNAHMHKSLLANGILFSGQAGVYLENNAHTNAGSSYANIAVCKPFSHTGVTFLPKISLGYTRDLNSLYTLSDQDGSTVSGAFKTPSAFALTPGIEASSTFSIKGIHIEANVNLEYTHGLGNKDIVIDSQNYSISQDKIDLDLRMKASIDTHTNLYATYSIGAYAQDFSNSFSLGVGVKI